MGTHETTAVRRRLTWQAAAVTSIARETASVVTIELEPPDWPGHRAGQHPRAGAVGLTADQAERAGYRTRVVDVDPG